MRFVLREAEDAVSAQRARIRGALRGDETAALGALLREVTLPPDDAERVQRLARELVDDVRKTRRTASDAALYLDAYRHAIDRVGKAAGAGGPLAGPGVSLKLSALHPRCETASASPGPVRSTASRSEVRTSRAKNAARRWRSLRESGFGFRSTSASGVTRWTDSRRTGRTRRCGASGWSSSSTPASW